VVAKFGRLAAGHTSAKQRRDLVAAVDGLDGIRVRELTRLLATVGEER
jgi:hypothetical protein